MSTSTPIRQDPATVEDLIAEIDVSLGDGITLKNHWYTDEAILDVERHAVIYRTWQYIGHAGQLASPGDCVATTIAEVPLVVVRGNDGVLRGFVNVCRHRGCVVVPESGRRSSLQCHYHGWTWDLTGELKGVPRVRREASFEKSDFPLAPVAVDVWQNLVFVNLDADAAPLASTLDPLGEHMASQGLEPGAMGFRHRGAIALDSNWKLIIDNMMECYHCPTVHPTVRPLYKTDPEYYVIERSDHWSYQRLPEDETVDPQSGAGADFFGAIHFYFAFPNFLVQFVPHAMLVMTFLPVAPGKTVYSIDYFFDDTISDGQVKEFLQYYEPIWEEDAEIVRLTHEGQAAGLVAGGKLFLDSEVLIQDFQRQLRRFLVEHVDRGSDAGR